MAYSEYFDIQIDETNIYADYVDICPVVYANYVDTCYAGHYNVATAGSHYYNYTNALSAEDYTNYTNTCTVSYTNTWSYQSNDKHADTTAPTWTSPWGGSSGARTLSSTYIEESLDAIKALRDQVKALQTRRESLYSPFTTDVETSSTRVGDTKFDDSNTSTPEYVEDDQYDAIRESISNIWDTIKTGTTMPGDAKDAGDIIKKTDWQQLASNLDNLASTVTPITYANHFNTTYDNKTYTPGVDDVD